MDTAAVGLGSLFASAFLSATLLPAWRPREIPSAA